MGVPTALAPGGPPGEVWVKEMGLLADFLARGEIASDYRVFGESS